MAARNSGSDTALLIARISRGHFFSRISFVSRTTERKTDYLHSRLLEEDTFKCVVKKKTHQPARYFTSGVNYQPSSTSCT